jgi:hypothetical protein
MHKIKGSCQEQWLFAEATWLYLINDFTFPYPKPSLTIKCCLPNHFILNKRIFNKYISISILHIQLSQGCWLDSHSHHHTPPPSTEEYACQWLSWCVHNGNSSRVAAASSMIQMWHWLERLCFQSVESHFFSHPSVPELFWLLWSSLGFFFFF